MFFSLEDDVSSSELFAPSLIRSLPVEAISHSTVAATPLTGISSIVLFDSGSIYFFSSSTFAGALGV